LSRAANWAKFSATAALGVIHRGHLSQALQLLRPYLPAQAQAQAAQGAGAGAQAAQGAGGPGSSSPYSEGGALYALGLIHANHGTGMTEFLMSSLSLTTQGGANEVVLHGCCLGLGLAAMATASEAVYKQLRDVLYSVDSAVAGEAAGIAMGLVMLGTGSFPNSTEMIHFAHEGTTHERVIRGLALGAALIMCGRGEEADTLIEQLLIDKDALIRAGGGWTLGLAYCGTGSNSAVRRLLHLAVTDVSDDVRRAALCGLGFVLCRSPALCPHLVSLLTDSFNPHVRYGATMALGIACAGTALPEATALLEPMTRDPVDFVRQGASIAMALVLIQTSRAESNRVEPFLRLLETRAADKHDELMSKFGAYIAAGLINAGGRNSTVALSTASGHLRTHAVAGLAVFCQYWYWHPYIHFASLALAPTAIIGVDVVADTCKAASEFSFKSNAPPSLYGYPPTSKPAEKVSASKGTTAVLSYGLRSKKHQEKEKEKEKKEKEAAATVGASAPPTPAGADVPMPPESAASSSSLVLPILAEKEKEKEKEKEPGYEILKNPARVTPRQRKVISFDVDAKYVPVRKDAYGIVVLARKPAPAPTAAAAAPVAEGDVDMTPAAAVVAAPSAVSGEMPLPQEPTLAPPAPFKFDG
jgi:26S proteasome regulatory subunit N2